MYSYDLEFFLLQLRSPQFISIQFNLLWKSPHLYSESYIIRIAPLIEGFFRLRRNSDPID